MKISEMSTEQLATALVRIAGPAERIGSDTEFNTRLAEHAKAIKSGNITVLQNYTSLIGFAIPMLLDRHKEDTYTILSAMTGKTVQEIAAQNAMQTLREAKECLDGDLMTFFGFPGSTAAGKL